MEALKNEFIATSKAIIADNKILARASIGFREMFSKRVVALHKNKIQAHFEEFDKLDRRYADFLNTGGVLNDLLMRNAKVQVLTWARAMVTGALKDYESTLMEFEGQVQFRLNVTLSVVALVVSLVATAAALKGCGP